MARFSFRLQPMLQLAILQRDQKRRDLADAYQAVGVLTDRHSELAGQVLDVRTGRHAASAEQTIRVNHLMDASRYELMLSAQVRELEGQLAQVNEELERRRQFLVEADRHVRTLEKLRERKLEEFGLTEQRRQQNVLDEVAAQRHGRRATHEKRATRSE
jgi:flagellar FliJ protein